VTRAKPRPLSQINPEYFCCEGRLIELEKHYEDFRENVFNLDLSDQTEAEFTCFHCGTVHRMRVYFDVDSQGYVAIDFIDIDEGVLSEAKVSQ